MAGGDQVVCACRLVTEEAVRAAIRESGGSFMELIRRSDAGTRCRGCLPDLWRMLEAERDHLGPPG
ncbi:MAG: (2Fe-2S)-binding protein [Acidimicrobiia bacterium]